MIIRTTGASLAIVAVAGLTIAGARKAIPQRGSRSDEGAAPPARAGFSGSRDHDEEGPPTTLRREMRRRGIPDEGLNAEWAVSAWRVGAHNGEPAWLLDMEDGTYEVVNRYYLGEDGIYRGSKGARMPREFEDQTDQSGDHIVVIHKAEFDQLDAANVVAYALQRFSTDTPKGHPAIRRSP